MTGKKYNVGIIGYGWVSGAHIAAINATAHAQVTAIYSSRKLDSTQISLRHGEGVKCYNDVAAMLADPTVHVVSICSYPQDHKKHAVAAAQARKHLIIEKPLALNWEDCLEIQKASARERQALRDLPAPDTSLDEEHERRLDCLRHCLKSLPADQVDLIFNYYQGEKTEKIKHRKTLANRLRISLNTLRMRALRLREKLEACVEQGLIA